MTKRRREQFGEGTVAEWTGVRSGGYAVEVRGWRAGLLGLTIAAAGLLIGVTVLAALLVGVVVGSAAALTGAVVRWLTGGRAGATGEALQGGGRRGEVLDAEFEVLDGGGDERDGSS